VVLALATLRLPRSGIAHPIALLYPLEDEVLGCPFCGDGRPEEPRGQVPRRRFHGLSIDARRGDENEADLSAQSRASEASSWLSSTHEDPSWTSDSEAPSSKGSEAPRGSDAVEVEVGRATGPFDRTGRILFPREYRYIRQCGRRAASTCFVLWVTEGSKGRRLGISVSKKVGNAVVRNRVKRAIREWFRASRGDMRDGVDLVVSARHGAGDLRAPEVATVLDEIAAKGGCQR